MTFSDKQNGLSESTPQQFSIGRINRLISDLELELAKAPSDTPNLHSLREEIEALKHTLQSDQTTPAHVSEGLHTIRGRLHNMTEVVEGEILKDSPYIAEIGRILGMV
jgi:hypothetical protein